MTNNEKVEDLDKKNVLLQYMLKATEILADDFMFELDNLGALSGKYKASLSQVVKHIGKLLNETTKNQTEEQKKSFENKAFSIIEIISANFGIYELDGTKVYKAEEKSTKIILDLLIDDLYSNKKANISKSDLVVKAASVLTLIENLSSISDSSKVNLGEYKDKVLDIIN